MSSFKNADAGVIVDQLIKTIQKERDYLSEIDGRSETEIMGST